MAEEEDDDENYNDEDYDRDGERVGRIKLLRSHKSGKRSQNLIDPCHARKTFEKFSG